MLRSVALLITVIFTGHLSADLETIPDNTPDNIGDATKAIDSAMRQFMWRHGVPGAAVAVAVDGEVVYDNGFGWSDVENKIPVTPTSRFRIGSITKPFTAVAILQLIEQGKLSLDDNPFDVIGMGDRIRAPEADPQLRNITIEQCLSHTTGFGHRELGDDPMFQEDHLIRILDLQSRPKNTDLAQYLTTQTLAKRPGTYFDYSNAGYTLLEIVLEQITEHSYEVVIQSQIAEPLGIPDISMGGALPEDRLSDEVVYYSRDPVPRTIRPLDGSAREVPIAYSFPPVVFGGSGGLVTSASSLVKFASDLDRMDRSKLLQEQTIRKMWSPSAATAQYHSQIYPLGEGYGLGWTALLLQDGSIDAEHGGFMGGAMSSKLTKFHDGCVVAVLFNTSDSAATDSRLADAFHAEILFAHAYRLGKIAMSMNETIHP